MNFEYLETANQKINNKPLLINMVSRRVKQLTQGMRPMVKPDHPHQENLDIALKEVAEGLLTAEIIHNTPEIDGDTAAAKLLSL